MWQEPRPRWSIRCTPALKLMMTPIIMSPALEYLLLLLLNRVKPKKKSYPSCDFSQLVDSFFFYKIKLNYSVFALGWSFKRVDTIYTYIVTISALTSPIAMDKGSCNKIGTKKHHQKSTRDTSPCIPLSPAAK